MIVKSGKTLNVDVPCPITMEAINSYVDYKQIIEYDEREEFLYLVSALDNTMLEYKAEALQNGN